MKKSFRPSPNSLINTFCVFNEVSIESINGLEIQYQSKSGSCYYYTETGMYRLSNHWGRLANSKWRLITTEPETVSKRKLGYANWDDFYPDNKTDKLYYLEVDYDKYTVNYQHKNNPKYDGKSVLRTSIDTTKKIKQVRNLLGLTSWAKYFEFDDINCLRKRIIDELIFTEKTLDEIKKEIA